jgi:hypothetical protein
LAWRRVKKKSEKSKGNRGESSRLKAERKSKEPSLPRLDIPLWATDNLEIVNYDD